ncbi:MAG TPA: hypothetical protein VGC51_04330 [Hansschlegelia sp.]
MNWTNEEGARFRPSLLGSRVFVGRHEAKDALLAADDAGVTLAEALDAIGRHGADRPPSLPAVLKALADLEWATWAMIQEAVSTLTSPTTNAARGSTCAKRG